MKTNPRRMLVAWALFGLVAKLYGQGTVLFDNSTNLTGNVLNSRVRDINGAFIGAVDPGTYFSAQLYAAAGTGVASSALVAVGRPVNFSSGQFAGYVQTSGTTTLGYAVNPIVTIPACVQPTPGGAATVQVRAWWTGPFFATITNYKAAVSSSNTNSRWGASPPLNLASTGNPTSSPPTAAVGLLGFQGFQLARTQQVAIPSIVSQPTSRTNDAGTSATFIVAATSATPLGYHWRRNGADLSDGGKVSGANTKLLRVSGVLGADAGCYSVLITNAFGSVISTLAVLTVHDPVVTGQPVGANRDVGESFTFSMTSAGTPPISYQWRKDGIALSGATDASLVLNNLQQVDAGQYDVLVSNLFGSVTSGVAPLTINLATVDPSFNPSADWVAFALAVQADGKILIGGGFSMLGGLSRASIGRLDPDGLLDTAFNPGADNWVNCLAVQPDGKILVGGGFSMLAGESCAYLGRLNPDGTLDASFKPGPNDWVNSIVVQPDGKILVGGPFTTLGGQDRNSIGRLNADGTLDTSFDPGANGVVSSLAMQPDGKILVGGWYSVLGGQGCTNVGRINADGTFDSGFISGANDPVNTIAVQPDGKILVGGGFTVLDGQPRNFIGRLNPNGTVDASFNPGADGGISTLSVQADGKILATGYFLTLGGQTRNYIGRLNSDGSLDTGFNLEANSDITALAVQADGKILVSGDFSMLGSERRSGIGRLNSTDAATQSLALDGNALTWLRGGASPEVWRTTFDATTNGTDWVNLGTGTRIPNGWQVASVSLPSHATIRARGYLVSGQYDGSGWFAETMVGPPGIDFQPLSRTDSFGATATLSVEAGGDLPLSYQWHKNGVALNDGGTISGATTASLSLSNLFGGDAGSYSVVISNSSGSVTSVVAVLKVIDPMITDQPASDTKSLGESASFSVTALGTMPFSYQWRRHGVALAGATEASLTLTNLHGTDAGHYDTIVRNRYGSVTSAVALLTINLATVDPNFDQGADGPAFALAEQADGNILVGGAFSTLGGESRAGTGRLHADGSLDTSFNPGADSWVNCIAVQPDGRILVGGGFSVLAGRSCDHIGRLNADGTPDSSFVGGASDWVNAIVVQPDGKIVVGGSFSTLDGQDCPNIGRLNADGSLDTDFQPRPDYLVMSLAMQPDGKILLGGYFNTLAGQPRNFIGRLNPDGSLDTDFNPGADYWVYSLAVQPDGKILVGGAFTMLSGQERSYIGRLNGDGTADANFNPGADGGVNTLAAQADGKILAGGDFTTLGGEARTHIGRLNNDGTLDNIFSPEVDGGISSLAVQADGKILVSGGFSSIAGHSGNGIGRLNNTDPATQYFTASGTAIAWLRGGASPEAWRTSFDVSTNGTDWFNLGAGTRIPGGWQLASVNMPRNATLRARGHVTGGQYNGSGWFVETFITPPSATSLGMVTNGLLVRQTGLFYQTAQITNPTAAVFAALRLWVNLDTNSIAHGVRVWNATNQSNGVPYLAYSQPLAPGQSVNLQIEYFVPDRRTLPNPVFQTEVVSPDPLVEPEGTLLASVRQVPLTNGLILVEFSSITGRVYYVQYSSDMTHWQTAVPAIIGTGTRVQWIDTGPPKTESLPSSEATRCYRVILLP